MKWIKVQGDNDGKRFTVSIPKKFWPRLLLTYLIGSLTLGLMFGTADLIACAPFVRGFLTGFIGTWCIFVLHMVFGGIVLIIEGIWNDEN